MTRKRITAGVLVLGALSLPAAPAAAQTVLLNEDGEGAVEARWTPLWTVKGADQPPWVPELWQKSDGDTEKYRGNMAHGGSTSFWAGFQPQNFPPGNNVGAPVGIVVEGDVTLTLKEPIAIPANGNTDVKYWSLFQNEGDDQGVLQAAPAGTNAWKNLKAEQATATGAGDTDRRACQIGGDPESLNYDFEEQTGSLAAYKGQKVLLRFNLKYGPENRVLTHPCGWYLDDIRVLTTGTPGSSGGGAGSGPVAGPPTPGTAPAAKPSVKIGATKLKGKRATLSLTISGNSISKATLTLLKGKKKLSTAKAATLAPGARKVVFKLKRKLKKGAYTVKITGTGGDGSRFAATGKSKAK